MKIISHRGNLKGKCTKEENNPLYIDFALLKKIDVEVDVWYINGYFFLGHDEPCFSIKDSWLMDRSKKIWCHVKNLEAIEPLNRLKNIHYFCHESDKVTLTNKGIPWCYPGVFLKTGITVQLKYKNIPKIYGICTDYPLSWL